MKTLCRRFIQRVGRLPLLADKIVQSSVSRLCVFVVALVSTYIAYIALRKVFVADWCLISESLRRMFWRSASSNAIGMTVNPHSFHKGAALSKPLAGRSESVPNTSSDASVPSRGGVALSAYTDQEILISWAR
jgi:hypothetical protein